MVDWPAGSVRFQPHQHDWLKCLWKLEVPIYVGYPESSIVSYKRVDPWQAGDDDILLDTGRVAAPLDLLNRDGKHVDPKRHSSLRKHLDKLTTSGANNGIEAVFVLVDKDIREFFDRLTGSMLVALFNPRTRGIWTMSGPKFGDELTKLQRLIEREVPTDDLTPDRVDSVVKAIKRTLAEKAVEIRRQVATMKFRSAPILNASRFDENSPKVEGETPETTGIDPPGL